MLLEAYVCACVLTGTSLQPPTTQFKIGSKNTLLCQARPQLSICTRSQVQAHSWILHQFPPSLAQLWKTNPRHAPSMCAFWTLQFDLHFKTIPWSKFHLYLIIQIYFSIHLKKNFHSDDFCIRPKSHVQPGHSDSLERREMHASSWVSMTAN